jgi:polysaccharide pyruvyl transferase WcaK-like protein
LAGGGYLTDLFPLDRILPPLELARRLKLPVATAPLGLGPFKSKAAADRVADALRGTELKLRDAASLAFCDAHGLVAVVEPDDAFSQVRKISVRTKKNPAGSGRPKIGVCIFPQHGQDAKTDLSAWWVQLLRGLQTQYPEYEVEGFCFHTGLQFEFCEMVRLFQNSGLVPDQVRSPALDFRRATLAIREYTFIIATRFHAIVAANVFEIPNVAIATGDYYLSKMKAAVCGHENLSQLVNPACVTPEAVLAICHCKLRNHPAPAP